MDTVTLVGHQIDDGWKLLDRLRQEQVPVVAAGWVKPVEEDRWSLYIATPLVDQEGPTKAYRKVYGCLRALGNLWVGDSDVKLVGENHPVTKDLVDLMRKYPGRMPTRSRRPMLGGVATEEIYVYPWQQGPTPARVVLETVMEMIGRPGPVKPSAVTLRDGTRLRGSPVGSRRLPSGEVQITLRDAATNTDQIVSIADVFSIQEE
jgi:hypothetical protein